MTQKTTLFSNNDWLELKKYLNHLGEVCCPPHQTIKPRISFKSSSDFQFDDVLKWGYHTSLISPNELKYIYEDKQTLKEKDINYIIVDGNKWFYNIHDKIGNFFLKDGSAKVEMEFPYWMEMTNIHKVKGVRAAIFDILSMYSKDKTPSQEEVQKCFSNDLCQQIYRKNPCREAIELAILEIMEVFRKKAVQYLVKNHEEDIKKERIFKRYVKAHMASTGEKKPPKVLQFLSKQKSYIYTFSEKFGLIKNSQKMRLYGSIRDHVRHPDEIKKHPIDPYKIYEDFCIAFDEPIKIETAAHHLSRIDNNTALSIYLSTFNFIQQILETYEDPSLKRKKDKTDYYNDLVRKGLLKKNEIKLISSRCLNCNEVAHLHKKVKNARSKVMNDKKMFNLAYAIHKRHLKIQGQKSID